MKSGHEVYTNGNSRVLIVKNFVPDTWQTTLENLTYTQKNIHLFGKNIPEPRLTQWYGEPYKYSGLQLQAQPFPKAIKPLLHSVDQFHRGYGFNGLLINYYRDGNDHMGWHSDNEKEIDSRIIASLSFGAARRFKFRNPATGEKLEYLLESGDLVTMVNMQEDWQHCVPKSKNINTPRINLTFRRIRRPLLDS